MGKEYVIPGVYKSVALSYGNGFDEVLRIFLSKGWKVADIQHPNYKSGQNNQYITFVSGANAIDVTELGLPNTKLL